MTKTGKVILISALVLTPLITSFSGGLYLASTQEKTYIQAHDSCSLSESEIRELWVASKVYDGKNETEQTQTAKSLVQAAENLCRETLYAKPTPLPSELQKMVR